jgi:homopolymeric O-antigen transport system ATP-binding protein
VSRPVAIRAAGVGKRYELGASSSRLMSDHIAQLLKRGGRRDARDEFWALRNVSLEVSEGEVVGLIGRNGAGKSTFLKILSRITPPTEGRVTLEGRVGSLLEVGTGFHPELTGRENIYLNGTILGMRHAEVAAKFDEIVEFSGIERFIDTPVKRYSSGMYVRLAFAVAAHLEPEILLVDEVLAVGDVEFQRKCLGKLRSAASSGRTIVFVSHNLAAVKQLCERVFLFDGGRVTAEGDADRVIAHYLQTAGAQLQQPGEATVPRDAERIGGGEARLTHAVFLDASGDPADVLPLGEPISLRLDFEVDREIPDAVFEIGITSADGVRIATAISTDHGPPIYLAQGLQSVDMRANLALLPGDFVIDVGLHRATGFTVDLIGSVISFTALRTSADGSQVYPYATVRGSVRPDAQWVLVSAAAAVQSQRT